MSILRIILMILYVIDCIGLVIVVLMQEGKHGGLGSLGGAASSDTYWAQNRSRSMEGGLVKITRVMAVIFFVLSIMLSMGFLNR